MKRNFKTITKYACAAITGVVVLASCTTNENSPGLEYMPDMYRSPAVEAYVDYGQVRGKEDAEVTKEQSALTPPSYTIPFYGTDREVVDLMLPYHRKPSSAAAVTHGLYGWELSDSSDVDAEYKAAAADVNPLVLKTKEDADAMFKEGKRIYSSKCMHCHGAKGDGNGPMMESGAFVGVPDYATKGDLADGQVFYSIYYGKGAMGAHASIVNNKEIWTLVHYVNKFRKKDYMKNLPTAEEAANAVEVPMTEAVDLSHINIDAERGHHLRLGKILFASNSDVIDMANSSGLAPLLAFMQSNEVAVELGGYTDTDGDDAHNSELSHKRAEAVKAYLVHNGVAAERVEAKGYGEANPVLVDGTEDKELSRRTELTIK